MPTEYYIAMTKIKDEPQLELTEIYSSCDETHVEIKQVEPKQEEELNSFLMTQDYQVNEDHFGISLKQEFNGSITGSRLLSSQHDKTDKSSQNDQPCRLPTKVTSIHNLSKNCESKLQTTNLAASLEVLKKYKCQQCSYVTKWKRCLLRHVKARHGSEEFQCNQCNFTTKLNEYLLKHVKVNHNSEKLICYHCSFATKWRSGLMHHIKIYHNAEELKCNQCNFTTKLKEYLLRHVKGNHNSAELKCYHCSFATKWRSGLINHIKVHRNTEKFKCNQCNFTTESKRCLRRHVNACHGLEEYKCNQCNFTTKLREYMLRHVKVHRKHRI